MNKILSLSDLYKHVNTEHVDISYLDYWSPVDSLLLKEYENNYGLKRYDKTNTKCISGCETCQISHIEKFKKDYPNHPIESLRKMKSDTKALPTHAFQVSCPLIPVSYTERYRDYADSLSEEDLEVLRCNIDPVAFAKKVLNWTPRAHQEIALRCQSKKKVYRFGRRAGKSDALAVEIIFHAFTKIREYYDEEIKENVQGIKILVCCPFDSQVSELFKRILQLLENNKELKGEYRYKMSPNHQIKFFNGAIISGFTTGQNGASAVRGQDAHIIVLDEVDYMQEKDFTTILPIAQSHPDCLIRAASTPTGLRSKFYEWCEEAPDWKEFYFPTAVIDETPFEQTKMDWKTMRSEMRREYTSDGWLQEVMALFMSNNDGVFSASIVTAAMENYNYEEMREAQAKGELIGYRFSIGVDWNTNVGTWICVTGYHPSIGLQVMEIVNVPKADFTQIKGLSRVTELLSFWKPDYLYVDKGHGATQWEMLKVWSTQQKPGTYEYTVQRRIKAYDFGSKVSIRDPATGSSVEHPAKPFLVQNAVRKFENQVIKFSFSDDLLRKQLLNYIIKNRQPNGMPVYGQDNASIGDHALDAFMLSLVSFAIEEGPLAINRGLSSSVGIRPALGHQILANKEENLSGGALLRSIQKEREEARQRRLEGNPLMHESSKIDHYSDLDRKAWERDMIVSRDNHGNIQESPYMSVKSNRSSGYSRVGNRLIK